MDKKQQKPSALQEAVNRLMGQVQNLQGSGKNFMQSVDTLFNTARNRLDNIKPPTNRPARSAQPIATLTDGNILYSDGTVQKSPTPARLETLRNNVLAQTNFTKEAEQYLRSLPLNYQTDGDALGVARTGGGPSRKGYGVGINPEVFNRAPTTPTEVMTHEFIHALDANVNQDNPFASFTPKPSQAENSLEFYPGLRGKANPKVLKNISGFLGGYTKKDKTGERILHPRVADIEAFAQYAAPQGEKVLLGPMRNSYGNIFTPATKVQNYSPVYPTRSTYQNLLEELEKQDQFGG